jgi:hypothetical protein
MENKISIGITTFKERCDLVKTLIKNIRDYHGNDVDIILMVNGNNEEHMDDDYRKDMLLSCANIKNCYPFIYPEFKSLSKMWNNIVIFSNTEYNMILNDDVVYKNCEILNIIDNYINNTNEELFTINYSFSHFIITKNILHKLGYFDERLLAFGEEDGDIVHRYIEMFQSNMGNINISEIFNGANFDLLSPNLETHYVNKPRINRKIAEMKYISDTNGIKGMSPIPLKRVWDDYQQYPYEMFIKNNKQNIKNFKNVNINYES